MGKRLERCGEQLVAKTSEQGWHYGHKNIVNMKMKRRAYNILAPGERDLQLSRRFGCCSDG